MKLDLCKVTTLNIRIQCWQQAKAQAKHYYADLNHFNQSLLNYSLFSEANQTSRSIASWRSLRSSMSITQIAWWAAYRPEILRPPVQISQTVSVYTIAATETVLLLCLEGCKIIKFLDFVTSLETQHLSIGKLAKIHFKYFCYTYMPLSELLLVSYISNKCLNASHNFYIP